MGFITGILKSKKKNDSIFVVINKLLKVTHFIPVKLSYKVLNIVDIIDILFIHNDVTQQGHIAVVRLWYFPGLFLPLCIPFEAPYLYASCMSSRSHVGFLLWDSFS